MSIGVFRVYVNQKVITRYGLAACQTREFEQAVDQREEGSKIYARCVVPLTLFANLPVCTRMAIPDYFNILPLSITFFAFLIAIMRLVFLIDYDIRFD